MLTRDFYRATPRFGPDDGRSAEEAFETAYQESRWDRESIPVVLCMATSDMVSIPCRI